MMRTWINALVFALVTATCPAAQVVMVQPSTVANYVLKESYGASDGAGSAFGRDTTPDRYASAGQWVAGATYALARINIKVGINNTGGTGAVTADIYSDSAGAPGTLIASSNTSVNKSDFPVSPDYVIFNFDIGNRPTITATTTYWVVLCTTSIDATNYVFFRYQTTGSLIVSFSSTTCGAPTWATVDTSAEPSIQLYAFE